MTTTDIPVTAAARPAGAVRYEAGSLIAGKYLLSEILGEGGMGSVWLAKNRTLDLNVALKVMRAELAENIEGIAERMLQEARAAASVGHPAIVKVFDFGFTEGGDPFIVMEVLHGESLHSTMKRRGRLSTTRAVQTLLPIIDALAATHARGIVHRDLKPENIFLARPAGQRLQPKVLDFGIAKLEQHAQERLTRGGAVIGSPAYMSPEQLRGEPDVDARADIWALSVVLYQMLTEHRPFEGDSYHASMWNVLNAAPRPISEHGLDEAELWQILERGLAKRREDRPASMHEFGRALALWLMDRGIHEDICDASLRAWLSDPDPAVGPVASFFPSAAPPHPAPAVEGSRDAGDETVGAPQRIEVLGMPQFVPGVPRHAAAAAEASGASPAPVQPPSTAREPGLSRWIPVTVMAAAAAFLLAAFWFGQRRASLNETLGMVGLEGVGTGQEYADSDAGGEEPVSDSVATEPPELPKSTLKYAPLPRSGPNAPLLYMNDAPRPNAGGTK